MIAVSLPDDLLAKLDDVVAKTGKKRSYLIRESLSIYLESIEHMNTDKKVELKTSKPFYETLIEEFKESTELVTDARKSPFTMFSDNGKLYVLNAKGNTRALDESSVNKFFDAFKATGSASPISYHDITFNSSYLLAALKNLMEREAF